MAGIHAIAGEGSRSFTNLTVSGGTGTTSLRSLADAAGYPGTGTHTITFTLPSGQNRTGPAGGDAIDTGLWPVGATLNLIVEGQANGGGGTPGINSGVGGDAINCQHPMSVTVNASGALRGAGGAGGTGGTSYYDEWDAESSSWNFIDSYPGGTGGTGAYGGTAATAGGAGTGGFGGDGGTGGAIATAGNTGGNGHSETEPLSYRYRGMLGSSGAAAGYAVRKNGHTVPVTNNGGTISGLTA